MTDTGQGGSAAAGWCTSCACVCSQRHRSQLTSFALPRPWQAAGPAPLKRRQARVDGWVGLPPHTSPLEGVRWPLRAGRKTACTAAASTGSHRRRWLSTGGSPTCRASGNQTQPGWQCPTLGAGRAHAAAPQRAHHSLEAPVLTAPSTLASPPVPRLGHLSSCTNHAQPSPP